MGNKNDQLARNKLLSSIACALPLEGGSYDISTMFLEKAKRKLLGVWEIISHTIDGLSYLENFKDKVLKGSNLFDPVYIATYDFREGYCLKKSFVEGFLLLNEEKYPFIYTMNIVLSWELEPGAIRVKPEMGYQYSCLNHEPSAITELSKSGEWKRVSLAMDEKYLDLTEGDDVKKLSRTI